MNGPRAGARVVDIVTVDPDQRGAMINEPIRGIAVRKGWSTP